MHCYNGNCKLHHLEEWYQLVMAIDKEGYAPQSYVQDNLNYIWKDLISLHKTKNSSRPLDVLSAKSHVLEITDFVLHSYKHKHKHKHRFIDFVQSTPISIQRHPSNGFRAHSIWQMATPTTSSPK